VRLSLKERSERPLALSERIDVAGHGITRVFLRGARYFWTTSRQIPLQSKSLTNRSWSRLRVMKSITPHVSGAGLSQLSRRATPRGRARAVPSRSSDGAPQPRFFGGATGASLRFSRACFFLLRSFRQRLTGLEPRPIASDPNKPPRDRLGAALKSLVEDENRSSGKRGQTGVEFRVASAFNQARADGERSSALESSRRTTVRSLTLATTRKPAVAASRRPSSACLLSCCSMPSSSLGPSTRQA
jgi:hypothetical protein